MKLPAEILLEIIQGVVDTLPIQEILNFRLVNSFFEDEIMTHLIRSPRLEAEGFDFNNPGHWSRDYRRKRSVWWIKFPRRFQVRYLHAKITRYPRNRCIFSMYMRHVLDLPHAPRTVDEEWLFVDRLIEAWLCGKYGSVRSWFDPGLYKWHLDRELYWRSTPEGTERWWKMFDTLLPIALATCAVVRGDVDGLKALIAQCEGLPEFRFSGVTTSTGHRFGGICPLLVAANCGSVDIVRTLIVDDSGGLRGLSSYHTSRALAVMATSENWEAMRTWIEILKEKKPRETWLLDMAIQYSIRGGKPQMVQFIERESGYDFSPVKESVGFKLLQEAITWGRLDKMQELLEDGTFDVNMKTDQCPYGALFASLNATRSSLQTIRLLLAHGADPNEAHLKTKLLPLHLAFKAANVELVKLLMEYKADVHAASLIPTRKDQLPLLLSAARTRSAPLVELALKHGVESSFVWRGQEWEMREAATPIADNERICYRYQIEWQGKVAEYGLVTRFSAKRNDLKLR